MPSKTLSSFDLEYHRFMVSISQEPSKQCRMSSNPSRPDHQRMPSPNGAESHIPEVSSFANKDLPAFPPACLQLRTEHKERISPESSLSSSQRVALRDDPMVEAPISPSRRKIMQLTGTDLAIQNPSPLPSQRLLQFAEYGNAYTFQRNREYLRSSFSSESSESLYSQNEADTAHDNENTSKEPMMSPLSPASSQPFYFQSGAYKGDNSELPRETGTTGVQSLRYHDRPSTSLEIGSERPRDYRKAMTLEDLVIDERNRFERDGFSEEIWRRRKGSITTSSNSSRPTSEGHVKQNPLTRDLSNLAPHPLAIRPKLPAPERSQSRFSDHSSDSEAGRLTQARDSVMSHLRSISSGAPFKLPDRPPSTFRNKPARVSQTHSEAPFYTNTSISTSIDPKPFSPEVSQPGKRKRNPFSTGKHPLKSPFPVPPGPRTSRFNSIDDATPAEPDEQDRSKLSHRLSDALKSLSSSGFKSSSPSSPPTAADPDTPPHERILYTHARRQDGPDTPFFNGGSPFHKRRVSKTKSSSTDWGGRRSSSSGFSPTERVRSSSMQIWGAVKEVGGVVRDVGDIAKEAVVQGAGKIGMGDNGERKEEKRRETLRKSIRVIGVLEEEGGPAGIISGGVELVERKDINPMQQVWL